jgi:hypothetical protein
MATIINTPGNSDSSDSGLGIILGVILAIILVALFVIYGIPALRGNNASTPSSTNINVTTPNPSTPTPSPSPSSDTGL